MNALEVLGVNKRFGPVHALRDVSFTLRKGEIHALAGQNGAGKSTLVQIITGVYSKDSGEIRINGKVIQINGPRDSKSAGIACIYQEPILVPTFNAAENIFLGRELLKGTLMDYDGMQRQARDLLERFHYEMDTRVPISQLRAVDLAIINICRALVQGGDILVLDEPTAALAQNEIKTLFSFLNTLKREGVSMIYISHHLEEVFEIADRVTVMRDGSVVATLEVKEADIGSLIEHMLGGNPAFQFPPRRELPAGLPIVFEARDLSWKGRVESVSFQLRKGEILGILGAIGAGKTELAHLLFGLMRPERGALFVDNKRVRLSSPGEAIRLGIALVPEDRKREGLIQAISVRENVVLPVLRRTSRMLGWLNKRALVSLAKQSVSRLSVKLESVEQPASSLSGGNQQKVVLAKWLATNSRILILDEPTQGIDVGAKRMIYGLLRELSDLGLSIIFMSSDADEVLGVADRVLILRRGRKVAEFDSYSVDGHKALDIVYARE